MDVTTLRAHSTTLLHTCGLLLLGGALLLVVILNVPQVIGAEHSYVVLSDSMAPTYTAGDVVIVQSVAPGMVQTGDVITFRNPGNTETRTTHRVVGVERRAEELYFETKGDANEEPDPRLISASQVDGRVWFSIPYIGYLLVFARSKLGIALLVLVPTVLLILTELWELTQAVQTRSTADSDAVTTDDPGPHDVNAEEGE